MAHDLYPGLVSFYRLDEFLLDHHSDESIAELVSGIELEHPIATDPTSNAETARRALIRLFGSDESAVHRDIKEDPETRNLYRGFSRFMLEDLYEHKSCKSLPSKSAKKKLCSQVGFLISRLLGNGGVALSTATPRLHKPASQPNYGINVIHSSLVTVQRSSEERNFHIPTQQELAIGQHNVIVELSDGKFLLLHFKIIRGVGDLACEELEHEMLLKRDAFEMTCEVSRWEAQPLQASHILAFRATKKCSKWRSNELPFDIQIYPKAPLDYHHECILLTACLKHYKSGIRRSMGKAVLRKVYKTNC
ncbi:hypothetical protein SELMODRAFT_407938 [Selaginella moellendorffii]|uniref:Uncharacterized protein n=1 Tax=Selaginella moellendorffii TaxID=88036 RepID=D8R594_SELML|nr:hypothetical protein SELMODRAFT_407938 [Selaginella moellendorffii]